ncbi:MAG: hypothetical protein KAH30_04265 [Caldisericia bacterium]|nr:hypothetical protein [Caldisericia bacterium]
MARKKRKKPSRAFVWTLIILFSITYIVFYTIQTQRVLKQDNLNQDKRNQITILRQKISSLKEKEQQISLTDIFKNAKELLGMQSKESSFYLPDSEKWRKNIGQ